MKILNKNFVLIEEFLQSDIAVFKKRIRSLVSFLRNLLQVPMWSEVSADQVEVITTNDQSMFTVTFVKEPSHVSVHVLLYADHIHDYWFQQIFSDVELRIDRALLLTGDMQILDE